MDPLARSPQEILAHSTWMRRLALDLVREPGAAEDVVQKAWLVALERGPAPSITLRAWLAGVVRNLSWKERRARARRELHESHGARLEAQPATDEVVARLEAHQQVIDALHALAEPYRRTLSLHYLDGISSAEIARREGLPAGTVRWRLAEGLARMRTGLNRRQGGDRRTWLAAWIPLVLRESQPAPSRAPLVLAVPGVLLMNAQVKLVVSILLALAATAGVWLVRTSRPATGTEVAPEDDTAQLALAPHEPGATVAGTALAPAPVDRHALAPELLVAPAEPDRTRLRARVLDTRGHPRSGARATLAGRVTVLSGVDGVVELEWPEGTGTQGLVAEFALSGFATRWIPVDLEPARTTPLGDVVLERGAVLTGLVLGPDGTPWAGAWVGVTGVDFFGPEEVALRRGPYTSPGAPQALSDPTGRFRVEGIAPGTRRAWAHAPETRFSWSAPLELVPGEERDGVELTLTAWSEDDTIEGLVLDPEGEPFPGAVLRYSLASTRWMSAGELAVDANGRFRMVVELSAPHDFRATDPRGRWLDAVLTGVAPGAREVEVRFREPRWIALEARTREGRELEAFRVTAQRPDGTPIPLPRVEQGAPGTARVPAPAEPFRLLVAAPGRATARSGVLDPDALPVRVSLVLDEQPGLSGRVVAGSEPIPGAHILLHALPERGRTYELDTLRLRVRPDATAETTTDAEGRFTLDPGASGEYVLLVTADGLATGELGPLTFVTGQGQADLVVALDPGGAIEGSVRMPEGQSPEGVIVAANRGDTLARSRRVGADGTFRFEGLAAGGWQLRRLDRMLGAAQFFAITAGDYPFEPDCRVHAGATTHQDLDLSDARACSVTGTLTWGDHPARDWTVALWPRSGATRTTPPSTVLDERGAFTLSSQEPGAFRLQFRAPGGLGEWTDPIDLVRGANSFTRAVETATLVVHRRASEALQLSQLGESEFIAALPGAATTAIELPSGQCSIGGTTPGEGLELSRWTEVLALTLAPGERREIELP